MFQLAIAFCSFCTFPLPSVCCRYIRLPVELFLLSLAATGTYLTIFTGVCQFREIWCKIHKYKLLMLKYFVYVIHDNHLPHCINVQVHISIVLLRSNYSIGDYKHIQYNRWIQHTNISNQSSYIYKYLFC